MDLRFLRFESFEMFDTKTKRLFFKSVLAPTDFHPPFSSVIYMYILELLNSSRHAFHLHIMWSKQTNTTTNFYEYLSLEKQSLLHVTFLINTAQIWPGGTCSTLSWRQLRFPQSTRRGSWTVQGNTSATRSGLESWIVGLWLMLLWTGKLFLSSKSKNLRCMRSTSK